jgi:invasion protein IalB
MFDWPTVTSARLGAISRGVAFILPFCMHLAVADSILPPLLEGAKELSPVYTSWVKACRPADDATAREVCFTFKNGRIAGEPVVAVVLIERAGEAKKTLRVTLPLGMDLQKRTWIMVDRGQQRNAPYFFCVGDGCVADYDADFELIGELKNGQGLMVQAVISGGPEIRFVLPLLDFKKAYEGSPSDPKLFE